MLPKQFGPYVIEGPIGAGGMGEVFRANDSRLGRTVAIKIIPQQLAGREELRQRFEIEARAIASLNHPHICALYDIGEQDGTAYMVMEYLEGQSLAERLKKGPLPLEEALRHAIHVADALDQAHRRGVYHRDIKPGNMMLTKAGVKLLDFGLARLRDRVSSLGTDDLTVSLTREGTVLGTPQYMAPEQVEGREVDGRADIFAFASVLYEMITGLKAFPGKDVGELMTAVLRCEPPSPLADAPALNRALRTCWARDPDERWQSAGDLRRELEWIAKGGDAAAAPVGARTSRRQVITWATSAAALGAVGGAGVMRVLRPAESVQPRVRFTITDNPPALGMNLFQSPPAISPDGKMVAFCAAGPRGQNIWIRSLDSTELRELPDTNNAQSLFWSPDSRSLAFFYTDQLKRISPNGGLAEKICDAPVGVGGCWNSQDVIVFQKGRNGSLFQVPASGGNPTQLTVLAEGELGHMHPIFLPDGKTILFTVLAAARERQGIFAATLGSTGVRRVSPIASNVAYSPTGHLLFAQGGNILAQSFDPGSLTLQGNPIPVASNVWDRLIAAFDVSASGTLVYGEADLPNGQLTWFERSGRPQGAVGPVGPFIHVDLTRDDRRVLVERLEGAAGNLWMIDTARGIPTPITSGPNWAYGGVWSPDGSQVAYTLASGGLSTTSIFRTPAGGGPGQKLAEVSGALLEVSDWSPDGKFIIFSSGDPAANTSRVILLDVSTGQAAPDLKLTEFLSAPYVVGFGRVSPDGRWMAYVSAETKSQELYVSPFPNPTAKWRISTDGGRQPRWRRDGKELYFLSPNGMLMAASIPTTPEHASVPMALFRVDPVGYAGRYDYAPSADGQRFLVLAKVGGARPQVLQVVTGWRP